MPTLKQAAGEILGRDQGDDKVLVTLSVEVAGQGNKEFWKESCSSIPMSGRSPSWYGGRFQGDLGERPSNRLKRGFARRIGRAGFHGFSGASKATEPRVHRRVEKAPRAFLSSAVSAGPTRPRPISRAAGASPWPRLSLVQPADPVWRRPLHRLRALGTPRATPAFWLGGCNAVDDAEEEGLREAGREGEQPGSLPRGSVVFRVARSRARAG
jgi:hypothetical protein